METFYSVNLHRKTTKSMRRSFFVMKCSFVPFQCSFQSKRVLKNRAFEMSSIDKGIGP